jgi:hypothetical protein
MAYFRVDGYDGWESKYIHVCETDDARVAVDEAREYLEAHPECYIGIEYWRSRMHCEDNRRCNKRFNINEFTNAFCRDKA